MDHPVVVIGKKPPENTHTSFGHLMMDAAVGRWVKGPLAMLERPQLDLLPHVPLQVGIARRRR